MGLKRAGCGQAMDGDKASMCSMEPGPKMLPKIEEHRRRVLKERSRQVGTARYAWV